MSKRKNKTLVTNYVGLLLDFLRDAISYGGGLQLLTCSCSCSTCWLLMVIAPSFLPAFPLLSCTISWVAAMQLYEELLLDCKRWKDPFQTCFLLSVSAFIHRLLDVRFVRQRTWSERGSHQFQWMNNEWSLFKFSFDMEWYRPAWHSNMRKQSCFGCTIWFMTAVTKWVGHKYVIKQSLVSAVNFDWFLTSPHPDIKPTQV